MPMIQAGLGPRAAGQTVWNDMIIKATVSTDIELVGESTPRAELVTA
jgi:hypothetical protein